MHVDLQALDDEMAAQSCGRSQSDHVHLCCTKYPFSMQKPQKGNSPQTIPRSARLSLESAYFHFPGYGSLAVTEVSLKADGQRGMSLTAVLRFKLLLPY